MHKRRRCPVIPLMALMSVSLPLAVVGQGSIDVHVNVTFDSIDLSLVNMTGVNATSLATELQNINDPSADALRDAAVLNLVQTIQNGNVSVLACPTGTYTDPVTTYCIPCSTGTYSEQALASNSSVCISCQQGTWSNVTGANNRSTCSKCPANTYSSTVGASSLSTCLACMPNSVSQPGSQSIDQCVCSAGFYFNSTNRSCIVCPAGSWCTGAQPQKCVTNAWSLPGSDAQDDCFCVPGYYGFTIGSSPACYLCFSGSYCPGMSNMSTMYSCPVSSSSPPGAITLDDCGCMNGYVKVGENERTFRVTGLYSTLTLCVSAALLEQQRQVVRHEFDSVRLQQRQYVPIPSGEHLPRVCLWRRCGAIMLNHCKLSMHSHAPVALSTRLSAGKKRD